MILRCLIAALAITACADDDNVLPLDRITVKEFEYRGTRFILTGDTALVRGGRIRIKRAQAHVYRDDEKVVITAPEFIFDKLRNRGHGDGPINVRSGQFKISGTGFDVDFENQRVKIRHQVHVTISDIKLTPLGNLTNTE